MMREDFPLNDPDRYRGYNHKSAFGKLLIQCGNIIDVAIGGEANPRYARWTDFDNNTECSLEATNAVYEKGRSKPGNAPAAIVSYELTRLDKSTGVSNKYRWHSGNECIQLVNDADVEFASYSPALMLEILGVLSQFDYHYRSEVQWPMPDNESGTRPSSIATINNEFNTLVQFNNDFHRKLGRRTIGRKKKSISRAIDVAQSMNVPMEPDIAKKFLES